MHPYFPDMLLLRLFSFNVPATSSEREHTFHLGHMVASDAFYFLNLIITEQSGPFVFNVMTNSNDAICIKDLLRKGEKKTSGDGLVLDHLYLGTGLPELDEQVSVTLDLTSGFPCSLHTGGAGGTARYRQTKDKLGPESSSECILISVDKSLAQVRAQKFLFVKR